jgi:transcriptional regulator
MTRRFWTDREDAYMRENYRKQPAAKTAKRLNRSLRSIYQRANTLGLNEQRDQKALAKRKARIKTLHAKGWSDSEIAADIETDRRNVTRLRNTMGIPANGRNARYRKKVVARTKQQLKKAGAKSLADIKRREVQKLANKLGWPDHLSLRSIQIVETLYRHGPMTRRQIAATVGLPWKGRKTMGNKNVPGQSYMAELQRAGLVIHLPRAISRRGKGNNEGIYMVALEVEPCPIKTTKSQ